MPCHATILKPYDRAAGFPDAFPQALTFFIQERHSVVVTGITAEYDDRVIAWLLSTPQQVFYGE
jgi:hypothetical protein